MVKFDPLWEMMRLKDISQYQLIKEYGISKGQLDRLRQNKNVTTNTLDILCNILDCGIGDIVLHIKDDNKWVRPE